MSLRCAKYCYKGYSDGNEDRVPVRVADVSLRA
jgi:hypothetical protein